MPEYTVDDTQEIWFGEHPDFERSPVWESETEDTRWHEWQTKVYRHKETGEHWSVTLGCGKTEMQEPEVEDLPVRVELREKRSNAKFATVTLPVGDDVLADFLEANGYAEQAQAVRGFVKEWEAVEEK